MQLYTFRFPRSSAAVRCFRTSWRRGRGLQGLAPCLIGFSFKYCWSFASPRRSSPRSSTTQARHSLLQMKSWAIGLFWKLNANNTILQTKIVEGRPHAHTYINIQMDESENSFIPSLKCHSQHRNSKYCKKKKGHHNISIYAQPNDTNCTEYNPVVHILKLSTFSQVFTLYNRAITCTSLIRSFHVQVPLSLYENNQWCFKPHNFI